MNYSKYPKIYNESIVICTHVQSLCHLLTNMHFIPAKFKGHKHFVFSHAYQRHLFKHRYHFNCVISSENEIITVIKF